MSTEKFLFEIAADTKALRSELDKAKTNTEKLSKGVKKTELDFKKFGSSAAKGMTIIATAVAAATAAVGAFAVAQGRAIRETEVLAIAAGVTTEEFKKMSFVMGTAGISGEKFGQTMIDTQEKVGDFLNSGGGGFQDFADAMGYTKQQATDLANEFTKLSGQEVLQQMVNRMQAAGVSTQRMSHALEGMASDTTRLIPLLKDNGKAIGELGDKYDEINFELSEEEKKQFADLATNVDLATASFTSMLQNAVIPLIPKMNELLETFTSFFKESSLKTKLFRIYGDNDAAEDIQSIEEVDDLLARLAKDRAELGEKINKGDASDEYAQNQLIAMAAAEETLKTKRQILEIEKEFAEIDKKHAPAEQEAKGSGKSGADDIKLKDKLLDDLEARRESQKSLLKILEDEKSQRLAILETMFDEENTLTSEKLREKNALKEQIESDYLEKIQEFAETEDEKKLEEYTDETNQLEELLNAKLISHENYFARLKELEDDYSSYKKSKIDLEDKWSTSSLKKQLDQGTTLLTALGNNSKTTHKINQGLSASNAFMSTREGVMDALASQNYVGAALIAATGAAQIAAILSSKPDGAGSGGGAATPASAPEQQTFETFNDQGATITDISGGESTSQRLTIEFNDEVVDAIARQIDKSKSDGRV